MPRRLSSATREPNRIFISKCFTENWSKWDTGSKRTGTTRVFSTTETSFLSTRTGTFFVTAGKRESPSRTPCRELSSAVGFLVPMCPGMATSRDTLWAVGPTWDPTSSVENASKGRCPGTKKSRKSLEIVARSKKWFHKPLQRFSRGLRLQKN